MTVPRLRLRSPAWLRWPRRTARLRLTALCGGLFLLSGAALVPLHDGEEIFPAPLEGPGLRHHGRSRSAVDEEQNRVTAIRPADMDPLLQTVDLDRLQFIDAGRQRLNVADHLTWIYRRIIR